MWLRYKVLDSRYDGIEDKVEGTDCDVHEALQIEHAMLSRGKKEKAVRGEEYEFVLEDQVEYVKDVMSSAEVRGTPFWRCGARPRGEGHAFCS